MSEAEPVSVSPRDVEVREAARTAWSSLRLLSPEDCRVALRLLEREFERVHGQTFTFSPEKRRRK